MSYVLSDIIEAFHTRLADPADGFNPLLKARCADLDVDSFEIDFDLTDSNNFVMSQFEPSDLFFDEEFQLPMLMMYEETLQQRNLVVTNQFAGGIVMSIKAVLSWSNAKQADYLNLRRATVDAIYKVFNSDPGTSNAQMDFQAAGIQYSGYLNYGPPSKIIPIGDTDVDVQTLPFTVSCTAIILNP